jgi:flagellar motor switch protein FliM
VGDVIELDTSLDSPLTVQVANKKQFRARVGKSGKRIGVQITGVYDEHDEPRAGL